MKVLKAVLSVSWLGTRMLPATKATPKEMLPLLDKPLIQYVVNEAVAAGIKKIVLVTHASKNAIENHFNSSFKLETTLEACLKRNLLEVRSIIPHDVIIDQYKSNLKADELAQMIGQFDRTQHKQIMVKLVPHEDVRNYGLADLTSKKIQTRKNSAITNIVAKPDNDEALSNLVITRCYVVSSAIWGFLEYIPLSASGEIQLTNDLLQLRHLETVEAYHLKDKSHDWSSKLGCMLSNVELAIQSSLMGKEFTKNVNRLMANI